MVNLENTNEIPILDDIKQELINQGYIKSKGIQKIDTRKKPERKEHQKDLFLPQDLRYLLEKIISKMII